MHLRSGRVLIRLLLLLAVAVGVGVLLACVEVFGALGARPAVTTDYGQRIHDDIMERQRAVHGEGSNQWPRFARILDHVKPGERDLQRRSDALRPDPNDPYAYVGFDLILAPYDDPYREDSAQDGVFYERARQRGIEALNAWRAMGIFEHTPDLPELERVVLPPISRPAVEQSHPELGLTRHLARA